ncbi:ATP-binding cassette domain-containing protein, partial [Acinetobacter baumannii]
TPTAGRIVWQDRPLHRSERDHKLAFVFQDPTLMPWARVVQNVRLPLDLAGVPKAVSGPIVADALARVGLADFTRAYPRELSGGMRMRVSL